MPVGSATRRCCSTPTSRESFDSRPSSIETGPSNPHPCGCLEHARALHVRRAQRRESMALLAGRRRQPQRTHGSPNHGHLRSSEGAGRSVARGLHRCRRCERSSRRDRHRGRSRARPVLPNRPNRPIHNRVHLTPADRHRHLLRAGDWSHRARHRKPLQVDLEAVFR